MTIPPDMVATFGMRFFDRKLTAALRWRAVADKETGDVPVGVTPRAGDNLLNVHLGYQPTPDILAAVTVANRLDEYYVRHLDLLPSPGVTFKRRSRSASAPPDTNQRMTGINQPRLGDPAVSGGEHGHVAGLREVVVRLPERDDAPPPAPAIRAGNVVPFVRLRRAAAPAPPAPEVLSPPAERPAPVRTDRQRTLFLAFLAVSLACHGSLYFLFSREPTPMASIGIEAISVEIMLGANMAAGVAETPGQSQATNTPADDPDPVPADTQTATAQPEAVQEAKPVQQARTVTVAAAPPEVKPEQPAAVTATETPPVRAVEPNRQMAALPVQETPAPRQPELTVAPEVAEEPKPAEPVEPQPVRTETKPEPQPRPKPVETREPNRKAEPAAKRKQERPGPVSRTASNVQDATGPRATAASGVGAGRSQADTNYPGIVRAHLARHQRASHAEQGSAMVSFGLDGSGRVTRVSLVRGSGHASLDQEAQAMVRRASPFPPPPDRAAKSFTVPVTFRIN